MEIHELLYWKDPDLATKLAALNITDLKSVMKHEGRLLTLGTVLLDPQKTTQRSTFVVAIVPGEMPPAETKA